MIFVPDLVEEA
jgi:hypothetical protein